MNKKEASKKWYEGLNFIEQRKVDKFVNNYQQFVKSRSRTQASKPAGIELVYSVKEYLK